MWGVHSSGAGTAVPAPGALIVPPRSHACSRTLTVAPTAAAVGVAQRHKDGTATSSGAGRKIARRSSAFPDDRRGSQPSGAATTGTRYAPAVGQRSAGRGQSGPVDPPGNLISDHDRGALIRSAPPFRKGCRHPGPPGWRRTVRFESPLRRCRPQFDDLAKTVGRNASWRARRGQPTARFWSRSALPRRTLLAKTRRRRTKAQGPCGDGRGADLLWRRRRSSPVGM